MSCRRLILAAEGRRDLIPELAQIIDRHGAVLTDGQVIDYRFKCLAGQITIDVEGSLFRGQVLEGRWLRESLRLLAENFRPEAEERRVAAHPEFRPPPARLALAQMLRHG